MTPNILAPIPTQIVECPTGPIESYPNFSMGSDECDSANHSEWAVLLITDQGTSPQRLCPLVCIVRLRRFTQTGVGVADELMGVSYLTVNFRSKTYSGPLSLL